MMPRYPRFDGRQPLTKETMNALTGQAQANSRQTVTPGSDHYNLGSLGTIVAPGSAAPPPTVAPFSGAAVYLSIASLPVGGFMIPTFSTIVFDQGGYSQAGSSVFTAPKDGYYLCGITAFLTPMTNQTNLSASVAVQLATGDIGFGTLISPVAITSQVIAQALSGNRYYFSASGIAKILNGHSIHPELFCTGNVVFFTDANANSFWITYLGPLAA
jgi:hypothetical protein